MNREETAARSFERALAALDGIAAGEPEQSDRKMFSIVAADHGAHTRITVEGFFVLWPYRRAPFKYFSCLAPQVVATLRLHAPSGSFARPFEIEEASLARLGYFRGGSRWFWVTRLTDAIVIDCRPATAGLTPPPVPDPLPPWRPAEKVFVRFQPPRPCARCSATPERYRLFDGVLICPLCGLSERVAGSELEGATVEPAG